MQTPVPVKTATPAPSTNTAVFKVDGDAVLNEWGPDTCYGSDPGLSVRSFGIKRPVFHFNLSNLPPNAVIQRATFRARATGNDNIPLAVEAVGLMREWSEWQVTWNRPRAGAAWGSPGANAVGTDRLAQAASSNVIYGREEWYEWDVTSLAQDWVSGKLPNHGLMLVSNDTSRQYQITLKGREGGQPAELVVEYSVEVPQSYTLRLYEGMNLISLPVLPADPSVAAVFGPVLDDVVVIWSQDASDSAAPQKLYDAEDAALAGLAQLEPGRAYWVQMREGADLPVSGKSIEGMTLALKKGENMVGYPSLTTRDVAAALAGISDKVEQVWSYDASDAGDPWKRYEAAGPTWTNDLHEFAPGRGYWIQVKEGCELRF
ncbi:MAG: DNRLRE domain-containing protein [Chloroflexi bacterium]|nr:DNRLRE domain-containing protein [Chloroflexota bacterium]